MANLLNPLVSDQDVMSEFFNTSVDNMRTVKYQTADSTVNNSITFLESSDLVIPVAAGASYIFESCLFYDTSSTADIIIGISTTVVNAALIAPWSAGATLASTANSLNQQGTGVPTTLLQIVCGGFASGTVMSIRPVGWMKIDTASGEISISHTQNVATAVNTILKQGSWISLARVG
jgi:hypothetical protein